MEGLVFRKNLVESEIDDDQPQGQGGDGRIIVEHEIHVQIQSHEGQQIEHDHQECIDPWKPHEIDASEIQQAGVPDPKINANKLHQGHQAGRREIGIEQEDNQDTQEEHVRQEAFARNSPGQFTEERNGGQPVKDCHEPISHIGKQGIAAGGEKREKQTRQNGFTHSEHSGRGYKSRFKLFHVPVSKSHIVFQKS